MVRVDTLVEVVQVVVNLIPFLKVVMVEEVMVDMELVILRELVEMLLTELAVVAVVLELMVIALTLTNLVTVETEPFFLNIKV